ncbi:MAG: hypothetical protein KGI11_08840 [Thaumarchaeota archaeon]|nr:hypothetical protein [Nitrososphaerota archaeon]
MSSVSSKIHITDASDSILNEIEALISKRKEIEENFEILRKKLLDKKKRTIDSENWEDWKLLSLEYDELKDTIKDMDEKYLSLKRLRHELNKQSDRPKP